MSPFPSSAATNRGSSLALAKGLALVLFLVCVSQPTWGQGKAKRASAATLSSQDRAMRAFEAARGNPLELRTFLVRMPKGADLHMHLSGAVYAESFLRAAAEDNLCVDLTALAFTKIDAMTRSVPPQPVCGEGKVPAAQAL